jgi:Leucine-rich repeat (LRR) protein
MYLSGFAHAPYLMIEPESDLENINPDFLENKYTVRLFGKFDNAFLQKFVEKFNNVKNLDIGNKFGGERNNSFIYDLPNLEGLVISLYRDSDFILDCSKLPKSLYSLNISTWSKKKIINIEALNNTNLEHLYISDFDEKDLTKISALANLKSLSITRSKIKSLKGIENLINLEYLSLGAVRSLEDISDIVACKKLKRIDFDICWKLQDFSPIGELKEMEILELQDCKSLASIKFVAQLPKLKRLIALGTTVINDYDTTPAENVAVFWGSYKAEYNKHYPEKEIK